MISAKHESFIGSDSPFSASCVRQWRYREARLGLSRWHRGLHQAITTFARDEIRRNTGDCFVHITEEMLDDSVCNIVVTFCLPNADRSGNKTLSHYVSNLARLLGFRVARREIGFLELWEADDGDEVETGRFPSLYKGDSKP